MAVCWFSTFGYFCVFLLANGVSGDVCHDKKILCIRQLAEMKQAKLGLMEDQPVNFNAIMEQCRLIIDRVEQCQNRLKMMCPAGQKLADSLSAVGSMDSTCTQATLCYIKRRQCESLGESAIAMISNEVIQSSPDIEAVKKKCSLLWVTKRPCITELYTICGNGSKVSRVIETVETSFKSICGKSALCDIEIRKCQATLDTRSSSCEFLAKARNCLIKEVNPACWFLPHVSNMLDAGLDNAGAKKCNLIGSALDRSTASFHLASHSALLITFAVFFIGKIL